jgi:hypothetical protein
MIAWEERSIEERSLLNPCFCANLLWHAAGGYSDESDGLISLAEAFVVLPIVLHRVTRLSLPRDTRTSLAVWLQNYPLARVRISSRAQSLVPFTKEALMFAGVHEFIAILPDGLKAGAGQKTAVNRTLRQSSDEVRECAKRARFVGRWFAKAGDSSTVLAMLGVQP